MKEVSIRCEGARSVSINDLHPFQDDIKTMKPATLKKLEKVIIEQGFSEPIAVWANSPDEKLWILNGHQRLTALQSLASKGWFIPPIPVAMVQADDEQEARKKVLTLASQFGDFSGDHLAEFVAKAQLDGDWLRNNARLAAGDFKMPMLVTPDDEEELPPQPDVPIVRRGEIYLLDQHRLMCGDSTSIDDWSRLMNGEQADLVWTDPPYNVAIQGGNRGEPDRVDGLRIMNDKMSDEDFRNFLLMAFNGISSVTKNGGSIYIAHADSEGYNFRGAAKDAGWLIKQCLIWKKSSMVMGRQDYHWIHEPILYGWKEGGSHMWYGDRTQTTVLEFAKPSRNGEHPTMKPVELVEYCINNSSEKGQIVIDGFGGSGTTLIAAEKIGRKSRLIELDPKYCGVILSRWESMSGKNAIRESDGRLWSDIKAEALSN